jgi:hypothetical protein
LVAQQVAIATHQLPHNKSLHPTAYSSVRSSLRFQQRVSSSVVLLRAALLYAILTESDEWNY